MDIIANGQLQHHFWGDYRATIILLFHDRDIAEKAIAKLPGFTPHPTDKRAVMFFGGGKELKAVEYLLVGYGASKAKLNSVAKSIDYGEPFTISVNLAPVDPNPARQEALF
jgi:hypothetical protein